MAERQAAGSGNSKSQFPQKVSEQVWVARYRVNFSPTGAAAAPDTFPAAAAAFFRPLRQRGRQFLSGWTEPELRARPLPLQLQRGSSATVWTERVGRAASSVAACRERHSS